MSFTSLISFARRSFPQVPYAFLFVLALGFFFFFRSILSERKFSFPKIFTLLIQSLFLDRPT
ncbi:hypothetical protein A946_09695 [Methylacidiphilum kamchatkense Kam1]|uniref:Uncharacterized protein n=1 Tax=Methylacidiphilum kamchatkense Kam1 TaxID=1202785 RepID=A0ABR4ZUK1_9BACT|nr:hypothetical protein A946_09695 [Methylacidiphilum kamchatkense Kam1]